MMTSLRGAKVRITYVTKSGETRIYEYASPARPCAAERCARILKHRPLTRAGKACWRAGQRGPVFYDVTVTKLIARGIAVRDGNHIRLKEIENA